MAASASDNMLISGCIAALSGGPPSSRRRTVQMPSFLCSKGGIRLVETSKATPLNCFCSLKHPIIKRGPVSAATEILIDKSTVLEVNVPEVLQRVTNLRREMSEATKRAKEYLKEQVIADEEHRRDAEDYSRRAYLYRRSAEIVQENKKKGNEVFQALQALQGVVLQDDSRTPADYKRRAEVFSKSAEVFSPELEDGML